MPMLHEVIAKEGDLKIENRMILNEATKTLTARTEHFRGSKKIVTMIDEDRQSENMEVIDPMNGTIDEKLDYVWGTVGRAIDVTAAKENTNSKAKADIIIGDTVIAENVHVTVLLSLENHLTRIRDLYSLIPTLAPSLTWEEDEQSGVMKSNEIKTFKTEKIMVPVVLAPATKEHKAQVKESSKDVVIGTIMTTHYSGMLSPADKSRRLGRISQLITAVREARQRANTAEVEQFPIAQALKDFIDS